MTDTEIIRTLATKCMEWSVFSLLESGYGELIGDRLIENVAHDWIYFPSGATWSTEGLKAWNPPTSISDAFQVVEKMGGMWLGPASNGHGWIAAKLSLADYGDEDSPATKYAETAARAICLAAIAALEGK